MEIPRKSQFGPYEAKKTTHEFSDDGLFILKVGPYRYLNWFDLFSNKNLLIQAQEYLCYVRDFGKH